MKYRVIDYNNEPKPVKTLAGAQRVAKRMACALGSQHFATVQEERGGEWVDVIAVRAGDRAAERKQV